MSTKTLLVFVYLIDIHLEMAYALDIDFVLEWSIGGGFQERCYPTVEVTSLEVSRS